MRASTWFRDVARAWRLLPRRLRLGVQVAAIVLAGGLVFQLLLRRTDIDSTAASLLVGVVLAAVGFLQTHHVDRRQRTVELIAALQTSDTLSAADCWMAQRISSKVRVDDGVPAQDDQLVVTLLDYYEFLCILAERGHLDGPLLADLRGPAMQRTLWTCENYVAARRMRIGQELYRRYEAFVQTRCQTTEVLREQLR